jgi:hypothetical protein
VPGARAFRRHLSIAAVKPGAGGSCLRPAASLVPHVGGALFGVTLLAAGGQFLGRGADERLAMAISGAAWSGSCRYAWRPGTCPGASWQFGVALSPVPVSCCTARVCNWPTSSVIDIQPARRLSRAKLLSATMEHHGRRCPINDTEYHRSMRANADLHEDNPDPHVAVTGSRIGRCVEC